MNSGVLLLTNFIFFSSKFHISIVFYLVYLSFVRSNWNVYSYGQKSLSLFLVCFFPWFNSHLFVCSRLNPLGPGFGDSPGQCVSVSRPGWEIQLLGREQVSGVRASALLDLYYLNRLAGLCVPWFLNAQVS